jgi:hypothetical protein
VARGHQRGVIAPNGYRGRVPNILSLAVFLFFRPNASRPDLTFVSRPDEGLP